MTGAILSVQRDYLSNAQLTKGWHESSRGIIHRTITYSSAYNEWHDGWYVTRYASRDPDLLTLLLHNCACITICGDFRFTANTSGEVIEWMELTVEVN